MKKIVIIAEETTPNTRTRGKGWRAAIYTSSHGAKVREAFAKSPTEAITILLKENNLRY